MRNSEKTLTATILSHVEKLPYFSVENLKILDVPSYHLRIVLSRLDKKGRIVRLKKGFYTSAKYLEKTKNRGTFSTFAEFMSNKMYAPSYLSLDYVLYENNALTEVPTNYTMVTRNKTYTLANKIGVFIYHKIKDALFCGYRIEKKDGFLYYKADRAKALFDFLYFRKRIILNKQIAEELRLNLDVFSKTDIQNLVEYVGLEGSAKMRKIVSFLI